MLIDNTSNSPHITPSIDLSAIIHTLALSPTAKPLPLSLACLLGERGSLLCPLAFTGNHELLEHTVTLLLKHGPRKQLHLTPFLLRASEWSQQGKPV